MLGSAGPADAHASLVESDPAEGAVLAEAPESIRLTFNETIAGVPDGVQVFDASGTEVESESGVSGPDLEISLEEEVAVGTLVVVWRVVSEDGHPVSGSLTFAVGAPSATVAAPPTQAEGPSGAPLELSIVRWIAYAGLFLAVGLTAFTLLLLPVAPETDRARRRLVVAARAGAVAAVLGWLVALPLVAVYQLGGDLGSLGDGATWSALATTEYVVTAAVVLGTVVAVGALGSGAPERPRRVAALVAAGIACCAPALSGHTRAATPEALAVATDVLHLLAGSVWLGGLTALALVLPDLAARGVVGAEVLARFSGIAAGVLAALVVSGVVLAWRIAGSWDVLTGTGYGRLLLAKIAAAGVAAGIAAWNRFRLLPEMQATVRRRDRRAGARLVSRATAAEAGVLVGVLLLTGLLVDRSPEPDTSAAAAQQARPQSRTTTLGEAEVVATVSPPTSGPATVTLEMRDANGASYEGYEAPQDSLSSDQVDLGVVPLQSIAPGTYSAEVVFPSPGEWTLQVSLRIDEFENPVTTVDFSIGGPG
ncbi:copper resistance protein CopC [Nocardioides sp. TF02-7]|uniref:copper resistance CopC/CopD family protein n=1 Tax=Nocardioides sp. TF02-7 TaxID=2917724 RepID=UPI001F05134A|nr:copper resistance protein CopC [Nocardioides sp. TF02-7]UMG94774.1 copper resistance protein CopC [Nocardioides sp. TF02-7]